MRQGKTAPRLTGARAGVLAAALLLALPAAPAAAEEPPLQGRFADAFQLAEAPAPAPETAFAARDGATVALADFRGEVVVLNFWATWCAPCIEEMPTLDALQAEFGGRGLQVLAVSEDRGGAATVEPFLRDKLSLDALDIYLDPKGALAQAFALRGLPTTYVIDARGRVVGHLEGPADWAGPAARALVTHYLERARSAGRLDTGG